MRLYLLIEPALLHFYMLQKIIFKTIENLYKYLQDMDIFKGENFNSDSL